MLQAGRAQLLPVSWADRPAGTAQGRLEDLAARAEDQGQVERRYRCELGVSKYDVAGLLRHHGLKSSRPRLDIDPDWLREQKELGRTDADIAAELGCSAPTVGYWRRKRGIGL